MTKIQRTKRFLPPERSDFINFPKNSPLKIRGGRGVMETMEITPFLPLILRGMAKERILALRGRLKGRGGFGI
jgi:hypothetical protein